MSRRSFGTVRRLPSGRWQDRYRERDGRQVSAPDTFATRGDARAWLARAQTDQARGELVDPRAGRVTLAEYAELFMGGRVLADRTVETYRGLLELHIVPALGTIEIGQLEPAKIRWWHAKLSREHGSTAAKAYRLLRTILNTAVKDELIPRNPCRIEGAAKEQVGERPIATVDEVEALVEAMPPRFRVVVLLAAWCQLRKAEICGLRRRDLDVVRGTVDVRQTLQQLRSGQLLLKGPKSDAGRRTIAIPPHVVPALVRHLDEFTGPEPDALVVTGEHGGLLRPHVLQKHWDRARGAVGRPDLHLHDLRHTGNTWAASTGASIRELMRRMGHSTPAAALRYQHATEQRDRAIADALAAMARPTPVIDIGSAREADPA